MIGDEELELVAIKVSKKRERILKNVLRVINILALSIILVIKLLEAFHA